MTQRQRWNKTNLNCGCLGTLSATTLFALKQNEKFSAVNPEEQVDLTTAASP